MPTSQTLYPVRIEGHLDSKLSRWKWLVKWLLATPHYIVLIFLWVALVVMSVVAFFSILFTRRYPRRLFDFNVGVLRWTWRAGFYTFAASGTDRYPPFSLADEEYPATLSVEYPKRLSRRLVLVKWWLLALPHYAVIGFFAGGLPSRSVASQCPGLIGILVLIAAVALLVTDRYPRSIFDLVVGLNRWVVRVGAYAALMTDRYPPFRLDLGATEPTLGPPPATL
jgi:hypothetical protein